MKDKSEAADADAEVCKLSAYDESQRNVHATGGREAGSDDEEEEGHGHGGQRV